MCPLAYASGIKRRRLSYTPSREHEWTIQRVEPVTRRLSDSIFTTSKKNSILTEPTLRRRLKNRIDWCACSLHDQHLDIRTKASTSADLRIFLGLWKFASYRILARWRPRASSKCNWMVSQMVRVTWDVYIPKFVSPIIALYFWLMFSWQATI